MRLGPWMSPCRMHLLPLLALAVMGLACSRSPADQAQADVHDILAQGDEQVAVDTEAPDAGPADSVEATADAAPDLGADIPLDVLAEDVAPALTVTLHGGTVVGLGPADLDFAGIDIAAVRTGAAIAQIPPDVQVVDVAGKWLAPAFVDSHSHLTIREGTQAMAAGGVAVVVDLAAPADFFQTSFAPLTVLGSGPMITAPGGFPLMSWGKKGYGVACADSAEAIAQVQYLHKLGARAVKVPLELGPQLSPQVLADVVAEAHKWTMKVATHTLYPQGTLAAGLAGVDILAHTPTTPMTSEAVAAWSQGTRALTTTLMAYGGKDALANVKKLKAAGVTILYATDFGNMEFAGIQEGELRQMQLAGMTGAEILAAGTSAPAAFWPLPRHGSLAVGKAASVLVLSADPTDKPLTLAKPAAVWIEGQLMGAP